MDANDFYQNIFKPRLKTKQPTSDKIVDNLLKVPKKDKAESMPHYQVPEDGAVQQADLLFLPDDAGHRYALVVVDAATRKTDAEPLKAKDSNSVLEAFKKIYSRNVLSLPKRIDVDSGAEFKGSVTKYFKDNNVRVKTAKVARHRQIALAETKNKQIGSALHKRMLAEETLTEQPSTEWVDDLPILIKALNKHTEDTHTVYEPKKDAKPVCSGDSCDILPEGTKVRVALDAPEDFATGKRLHGKFRSSDVRWNETPRVIKQVLIAPDKPPMYLLDHEGGIDTVSYTRNQLQVIPANEKYPDKSVLRKEPETYRVEKLLSRFKKGNRVYYRVRWLGFNESDDTDEPRSELIKTIPNMVQEFENNDK